MGNAVRKIAAALEERLEVYPMVVAVYLDTGREIWSRQKVTYSMTYNSIDMKYPEGKSIETESRMVVQGLGEENGELLFNGHEV